MEPPNRLQQPKLCTVYVRQLQLLLFVPTLFPYSMLEGSARFGTD